MTLPLTRPAQTVFAPTNTFGVARGADMAEAQLWGTEVEASLEAGSLAGMTTFATRALLNANLAFAEGVIAWVTNDTTAANNGFYRKNGASGTGSWTQISSGVRDPFLSIASSGTANAITGTTVTPGRGNQLYALPILADNTGAVTLALNGAAAKPLVTNTNQALPAGYLKTGMLVLIIEQSATFRLLSYGDASAIQAAAEAAAATAVAAAANTLTISQADARYMPQFLETASDVVGRFIAVNTPTGEGFSMPAGGTWIAYLFLVTAASGAVNPTTFAVRRAGGSLTIAAQTGVSVKGFAVKVA